MTSRSRKYSTVQIRDALQISLGGRLEFQKTEIGFSFGADSFLSASFGGERVQMTDSVRMSVFTSRGFGNCRSLMYRQI